MSCAQSSSCSCPRGTSFGQHFVNQTPRYDNATRKRRVNQVIGKGGIIRPDKRKKAKYL